MSYGLIYIILVIVLIFSIKLYSTKLYLYNFDSWTHIFVCYEKKKNKLLSGVISFVILTSDNRDLIIILTYYIN